jgi:hypothetical protein
MVRTPTEDLDSIAGELQALAPAHARHRQRGSIFREDVERIVSDRLARERHKTASAERERDELQRELD